VAILLQQQATTQFIFLQVLAHLQYQLTVEYQSNILLSPQVEAVVVALVVEGAQVDTVTAQSERQQEAEVLLKVL